MRPFFVPNYPSSLDPSGDVSLESHQYSIGLNESVQDTQRFQQYSDPTFSDIMRRTAPQESVYAHESYIKNFRQPTPEQITAKLGSTFPENSGNTERQYENHDVGTLPLSLHDISSQEEAHVANNEGENNEEEEEFDHVFHLDLTSSPKY